MGAAASACHRATSWAGLGGESQTGGASVSTSGPGNAPKDASMRSVLMIITSRLRLTSQMRCNAGMIYRERFA
jgi:hypothetical protein